MTYLFTTILNMSITASYIALAVIAARLLMKRVPRIFSYVLWLPVLIRLVFPFSFSAGFSFLGIFNPVVKTSSGAIEYVPRNLGFMQKPAVDLGITGINNTINSSLPLAAPEVSVNLMQILLEAAAILWIFGIMLLLIYSVVSYIKVRKNLETTTLLENGIFESDRITTPFVFGFIRPKIFIPIGLGENELPYIIAHERTHIKRLDYIIKPLAFLVLAIHWFNPLMWISYAMMSKDMEMSCDDSVLKKMGNGIKTSYANSLLSFSMKRSGLLAGSPLAFGESSVKSRIKNVLAFKKPAFWVIAVTIIVIAALAAAFTANPVIKQSPVPAYQSGYNAEVLFAGKTAYVGDNSKVVRLVKAMPLPVNIVYGTVELQTSSKPYGVTINLKTPLGTTPDSKLSSTLYRNSVLLFSLIDNAYIIQYKTANIGINGEIDESFLFTREMAEKVIGGDIRSCAESADTLKNFITRLNGMSFDSVQTIKGDKIHKYLDIILSSPKESSNPDDYIKAHPNEYESIIKMGDAALNTLLEGLVYGGYTNSLKGYVIMELCKDLLGDRNNVKDESLSPQEWLLQVAPYVETKLPDFIGAFSDQVERRVYDSAVKKYSRPGEGFTIVAPTIFYRCEEGNKLKVFVTVYSNRYRLFDKTLSEVGGSVIPAAITYTKDKFGNYTQDEYLEAMDGSYFIKSIKEYCITPVTKKEIKGLFEKITEDYGNNKARSELLEKNLIEHLKARYLEGVILKRPTGESVPLT